MLKINSEVPMQKSRGLFETQLSQLVLKNHEIVGEVLSQFLKERNSLAEQLKDKLVKMNIDLNEEWKAGSTLDQILTGPVALCCLKNHKRFKIYYDCFALSEGYIKVGVRNNKTWEYEDKIKIDIKNHTIGQILDEITSYVKSI